MNSLIKLRQEIRNEQRDAYKVYMTDINGNRFKDWKGRPLRETKSYSYFNFNSWTHDHMTDPRWRGIERGLVRASELPSPAPATTLFDNSDNPTAKVSAPEAKIQT